MDARSVRSLGATLLVSAGMGCGSQEVEVPPSVCDYPADPVEPMALDEVIAPYAWADARHRDGRLASLDLVDVPCDGDDDIDWSPFDVLLFVSIPAW